MSSNPALSSSSSHDSAQPSPKKHQYYWIRELPFFLVHLSALTVFFVPFSWDLVALCLGVYIVGMFAVTGGYHRYFSHRTYKMNRFWQFVMAWMAQSTTQKGVLWWAANHRHHHKHSDQPTDLHSPRRDGFWYSHVGWIMDTNNDATDYTLVQDLAKFPELVWLNKYYLVPVVAFPLALLAFGGWAAVSWGFCLGTVLVWHGTFTINSLSHVFGSQRYESKDDSRNNPLLALITLGEGWHNNHHAYMSSTNQGFFWWELDITYGILKGLSWVGVTHDLRKPPLELLEARRIKHPDKALQLDDHSFIGE